MCLKVYMLNTLVTKVNWLTNARANTHVHTQRLHHTISKIWVTSTGVKVLGITIMLSTMKDVLQQLEKKVNLNEADTLWNCRKLSRVELLLQIEED